MVLCPLLLLALAESFTPPSLPRHVAMSLSAESPPPLKEYSKLFGRLSDKFILLDASAGKCCYSGCTGCEFRLPDGGYKMSEQSASRAKWVLLRDSRVRR